MKTNTYFIIAFTIIAAFSGCGLDQKYFFIDNPTTKTIHVVLDDSIKYEIKPGEYKKVNMLADGKHTMQTDNGSLQTFEMDKYHTNGLLNAAGAKYVNVTEIYALKKQEKIGDISFNASAKEIKLDSTTYYGIFTVKEEVYIECDWKYDVTKPFPKTTDIYVESKTKLVTKLFRLEDFKKEYADSRVTENEKDTEVLDRRDFYRATVNKKTIPVWNNPNDKKQVALLNIGDTVDVEIIKGKHIRITTLDNHIKGYVQREDVTNIKAMP